MFKGSLLRVLALLVLLGGPVFAAEGSGPVVPNFWDTRTRIEKPDLSWVRVVRVMTDDEFPPLHFAGPDGVPTGFAVELARAACEALSVACTIQARRFDTLLPALEAGHGDVVAAGIPVTATLREGFAVTFPFHRMPARFVVRREKAPDRLTPEVLAGHTVAVIADSAHEAFLKAYFPEAEAKPYANLIAAREALRAGEVDYLFGDGMSLALWLNGRVADDCCRFVGGPYLESRYFGEGVGFVLRKDDKVLRRAFDYALQRLWDNGTYTELYLRYFPVGFY
ncbi:MULTISPECIES: transporter substrate-binding domain-containing protein [unclassified Chelatococcus]|uniref:transporter substrate-binding domain-containing protein n=1 Tax=unclassified Chelatococcus TaxID=2638111 RepID=UPI0002EEA2D0|nr:MULTISPECIES: transporter substrate-binding domain-containing protein [unclassified Chelatococcus]ALA17266.1 ABC transporter substrate-binding protein [Chelatococcus sp. CO-6]